MKQTATQATLAELERIAEQRKQAILQAPDALHITGCTYYVSNHGSDDADGKTPETAWKTLARVSTADLREGDGVRFCRGDLFRGKVITRPGVSYGAFGEGEKPKLYGWDFDLADPTLWEEADPAHHIWRMREKILDPGTLVFDEGKLHSYKHIPSYLNGTFVCRDDPTKEFIMGAEMTRDLDLYWYYESSLIRTPSRGEDFPIPSITEASLGELYLRCDRGNPGTVFSSIEAVTRRVLFSVGANKNVHIDNLCMKYVGIHAVAAGGGLVEGLRVTNCEIGWIGGTIQHYFGTDPNYPQGGRGTVTRFGNGVEIYGSCNNYEVSGCYIYQSYDAGMTHQMTTGGNHHTMTNIQYKNNLVERCVYSIEYFLDTSNGDDNSYMDNIEISGNILRFAGCGWGQQRHNVQTPAHIKGWSYENRADHFRIHHNLFDRSAYRLVHLVAKKACSCPMMEENTYVQTLGGMLGQYGANEVAEPLILPFDEHTEQTLRTVFGEKSPTVYFVKE